MVEPSRGLPPTALLEQYRLATDLYMHEDRLNWQKFHCFFYLTAGLIAAIGVILRLHADACRAEWVLIGGGTIGAITSLSFGVALHSGIRFLEARHIAACAIEDRLRALVDILPVLIFRRSLTRVVLQLTPLVVLVFWLALATVGVLKLLGKIDLSILN